MLSTPRYANAKMRLTLLALFFYVEFSHAAVAISRVSQARWLALNATVKGRLRSAEPFSRPCFDDVVTGVLGEHNIDVCSTVVQTYTDPSEFVFFLRTYPSDAYYCVHSCTEWGIRILHECER